MDHLADYKKLSVIPDYNEKYIYFPLQMTPEASTMPFAGEFRNQILSIELLASVAKSYGIKVYVKEHWVQYNREPGFYNHLAKLENVELVKLETNSIKLIENSFMVASQTGNCLFEALLKKKYAISIGGNNAFKAAPNIFCVKDAKEIDIAIETVLNDNKKITDEDINRYLLALDKCLVYSYLDSLSEAFEDYDKEVTAKEIVDFTLRK
jgi:capsule polysaccharide export protein KpsC/LpsZ